jgi:pyruvate kinase
VDHSIAILQDLGRSENQDWRARAADRSHADQVVTIEFNPDYDDPVPGGRITTAFAALFTSVERGARLLVDEGRIELEVLSASAERIEARVLTPGKLDSHKGINVPGVVLHTPAMTEKDEADLLAGIAMGVDIVGVSFVQTPDDMQRVRAAAVAAGAPDLMLVAKIEKPLAVDRIEEIIEQSDGVMVARGDLGIEMPLEVIPAIRSG